jgi:hypothetical protein
MRALTEDIRKRKRLVRVKRETRANGDVVASYKTYHYYGMSMVSCTMDVIKPAVPLKLPDPEAWRKRSVEGMWVR